MTVEHLWFNNKKIKGHNREKFGTSFPSYQYDVDEIGFRILHDCAVVCSEAVFDSSLPQD
jgi:sodium/potassium-transporting ATPase subunit alpha